MKKAQINTNKPFPFKAIRGTTPDGRTKRFSDFTYRHTKHGDVNFITIKVDSNLAIQTNNDGGVWCDPYFVGWLSPKADIVTTWDGIDETN